jgi:hypothetical protein
VGITVLLALSTASYGAEKLNILWAQWDPANYLQELVKDYQKETGVEVVVETTPWPDFQTKAFTEREYRKLWLCRPVHQQPDHRSDQYIFGSGYGNSHRVWIFSL